MSNYFLYNAEVMREHTNLKYTQIYIASYIKVYWCHILHIYIYIYIKEYINIRDIHMLTY